MVERNDPAKAGVKAGRVVGLVTAVLAVVSLLQIQGTFYEHMASVFGLFGVDPGFSVAALFWVNAALTATARYTIGYVVGSLLGVVYDWVDRSPLVVVGSLVVFIGIVDGIFAGIDARSVYVGTGYLLAWLCYVPAFVWLFDPDAGDDRSGPLRL